MHFNCDKQKAFTLSLREMNSELQAFWIKETTSTNDDVKMIIKNSEQDVRLALVSDKQTCGRGTRGRKWNASAVSVLLTVGVPLSESVLDFSGLTLVLGAACVDALFAVNSNIRLKWPNDLWLQNGKVAGILCELVRNKRGRIHAVVGIGVNICLGQMSLETTDQTASALYETVPIDVDESVLRVQTATVLTCAIERACTTFGAGYLQRLQRRWPQLDAFFEQQVLLSTPSGEVVEGFITGIGSRGELLFTDLAGQVHVYADARIRPHKK